ncbi:MULTISPECIES: hypothetical protein [Streptomyces]|uniref:hypothetical protein n=1 Tax=Streptomyces TaxID=1883 RepID=UPI0016744E02|nr:MULTISPECIES: hypothetical protein [Streptomyces]MBD3575322.1 hypothetical protein [Streptomyces sp. KD18]GGS92337.1 hypothetical protein GCM10010286_16370 [Streptomyces toxytricini]
MELIGFYRELQSAPRDVFRSSLRDQVRSGTAYPKAEVTGYFMAGHPVFDVMESTRDVLEGRFTVPGGSSLLSDGRFVWRADLARYVDAYNLALPAAFLSFAEGNGFSVPAPDRERLLRISVAAGRALGFREAEGSGPDRRARAPRSGREADRPEGEQQ